jgi:hypothetical protein
MPTVCPAYEAGEKLSYLISILSAELAFRAKGRAA